MSNQQSPSVVIGVLALQGAFEEHQRSLEAAYPGVVTTIQIRTPDQFSLIDGIVLPGGESTAMGLIGDATTGMWDALRTFTATKPVWGTCAGMILLAERCVGTSAVIAAGQSLVGGMDVLVCRNYFGSQVSSFEMDTPAPPPAAGDNNSDASEPFPGVFIRAPAILSAGPDVKILGTVIATPCRAAAVVLRELERKIEAGENVVQMGVVDALERTKEGGIQYAKVKLNKIAVVGNDADSEGEEKKETTEEERRGSQNTGVELPGASDGTNAREVICAARKGEILCTAFHPEIADDLRWHQYFVGMVREANAKANA